MAENLLPVWNPTSLPSKFDHPFNLPKPEKAALSVEQRKQLKEKSKESNKEQIHYLNKHPEIRGIIREFFQQLINKKPTKCLFSQFCKEFFQQPKIVLQEKIENHVKILKDQGNGNETDTNNLSYPWYWTSDSEDDSD